jgi:aryl-phospho-beta-D-glucosidase BglC (GH1 family)
MQTFRLNPKVKVALISESESRLKPLNRRAVVMIRIFGVLALVCSVTAAPTAPAEMQKKMGLGINLGNRLDLAGTGPRDVQEKFFDAFHQAGFTNVRIPVCWDGHTNQTAPYTVDPVFLDQVYQYANWSLKRGMVTVLNTHHEDWLDTAGTNFDAKLLRFEAIWTQIAAKFAGTDENLLFEIFNEPHAMSADNLNKMNAAIVPIIRKLHPTRIIMLQGLQYGNPNWITKNPTAMTIPKGDTQLMLEIHFYDPFTYAGSKPSVHSWGSAADKAALEQWADDIDKWAAANSLPIYYGEWAVTTAQTKATGRDNWYKAHADMIAAKGWAASVWSDGMKHLIFDYADSSWVGDILVDLGKNPARPTPPPAPTPKGFCNACGYACDANCICNVCNIKPGCDSESQCMGNCNGGKNAKWCGGQPTPPPAPVPVPPTPQGQCNACGYSCDANCICGRCNEKPGCDSEDTCMGNCNAGKNAKWCGGGTPSSPTPAPPGPAPTPTPAPPGPGPGPVPSGCPGTAVSSLAPRITTPLLSCPSHHHSSPLLPLASPNFLTFPLSFSIPMSLSIAC